ncbi:YfhO family protein [Kordia sp. YSTF-M3]|uniref:YfhO family protein n=1 Tax=Kordia aestuariivivens TaxID=2759037 RepID=A0ABR7QFR6_9FLAO|nr:YfhO family protein [Kordia aestuariivivens]MBC8757411.1 YfhO family protein [Kordia aestuariivivens]
MNIDFKKIIPHAVALLLFVVMSLAYFYPVVQGKKIQQTDIVQYAGMAKKQNQFREATGEELYWTDNAFGGMPTYLLGARYPHSYIKTLDRTLRFLPRPADYLFLYFLGIYVLLLVMKVNYKLAFLGAVAFGFSTYFIIILGVGHNAKAHAIAYFPLVLAGILLTFQRKYIWGFLLTAVAMSLEIMTAHPQMTYYLMLLVIVLGIVYFFSTLFSKEKPFKFTKNYFEKAFKNNDLPHFFKAVGLLSAAVVLGIGVNGTNLLTTKQYADWSMRGKSELTINPDGSKKERQGLSKEYITEYSYGKMETFNLLMPRFMGGANSEDLGTDSKTYKFLLQRNIPALQAKDIVKNIPAYWGQQPIVAGPAYIGAVIIFLAFLGLFLVRSRAKWWLVGGILMSLLLSWGKNLSFLTDFMLDYFPLYSKFRAVSSIQVILELCIPILGVLALASLFNKEIAIEKKKKAVYISTAILSGIILFFMLFKSSLFDFVGLSDEYYEKAIFGPELMEIIREDRSAILTKDAIRSLLLILATAVVVWSFIKEKLKENIVIVLLVGLLLFDLVSIARHYVSTEGFVSKAQFEHPYRTLEVDKQILQDKGHYRVFEPRLRMANSRTAYFHNTLGGYHAAKPRQFQELYDFYLDHGNEKFEVTARNINVINMMNVKYIIKDLDGEQDQAGAGAIALLNPYPNGNAWFVKKLNVVDTADEEMLSLFGLDTKEEAVIRKGQVAAEILKETYGKDSLSSIELISYLPSELKYTAENSAAGLAVFSEIHYPHGWNAYIDGELVPHYRVNYVLRALEVPAGKHTIDFKFEPKIVSTGIAVSLTSTIILVLLILGALYYEFKRRREVKA